MTKAPIEDLPNYEKELAFGGKSSGAILNKDVDGLDYYKKQKNNLRRIDIIEREVKNMKNDLTQILEILKSKH